MREVDALRAYALPALLLACMTCAPQLAWGQQEEDTRQDEGTRWLTDRLPDATQAEPVPPGPLDESLVELRVWGESFSLPGFGEEIAQDTRYRSVSSRLRARFDFAPDKNPLATRLEADFLAGRITGAIDPVNEGPQEFSTGTRVSTRAWEGGVGSVVDPRALSVSYESPVGLVSAGLQTSTWGLGLLANAGDRDDLLFNQQFGGDRVVRALFATLPFAATSLPWRETLFVAVGGDVVWRDENASLLRGDRAYQGVVSVFKQQEDRFAGVYVVARTQEDEGGTTLDVVGADVATTREWSWARWDAELGGEAATLRGRTTRALPTTAGRSDLRIKSIGAALEGAITHRPSDIGARLMAGYASGDADVDDDTQYRFRFDPNYKVGLVLFDHYLPAVTRSFYDDVNDPGSAAQPPRGIEQIVSEGGVENAVYINPQLTFGDPDELLMGVGLLRAWSPAQLADPRKSLEQGGTPTGVNGQKDVARDLGLEVDVAAQYRRALGERLSIEVKAEFGILLPGEAFDNAQGEAAGAHSLLRGRASLIW